VTVKPDLTVLKNKMIALGIGMGTAAGQNNIPTAVITPAAVTLTGWVVTDSPPTETATHTAIPTKTMTPSPEPDNITETETPVAATQSTTPETATVTMTQTSATGTPSKDSPILYYTQAGDTLSAVAVRFGVETTEIKSPELIPEKALFNPGQLLVIPNRIEKTTPDTKLLPDSEIVFSPSAVDFDIDAFVNDAGGYLSTYREYLGNTGWTSGAGIIERVAQENSVNPRLLLAIVEYLNHWVYGQPETFEGIEYPLLKNDIKHKGFYMQLAYITSQIQYGYYGWREGRLIELTFKDGAIIRPAPNLNAGSVALQYAFTRHFAISDWEKVIYSDEGLPALHKKMFGDPWIRAQKIEPLFPPTLTQPKLILPFELDKVWSHTGGPHPAWKDDGSYAALDFAPATAYHGCAESAAWVIAPASGLIVRSGFGVVTIDLDGDGSEQTGWVIFFLHIKTEDRISAGQWVNVGDRIGHPSCEGGAATGTHVHIARKYNGEWIPAGGSMPFTMSGWEAHAGKEAYEGTLTRGDKTVTASVFAIASTNISRLSDDPYEK
jgi:LasA protease